MNELITQVRAASDAGLYFLALMGTLVIADICGALESENGRAGGPKFENWLRANVPEQAEDADLIYGLRCSLLHEGSMLPHGGHFPIACMYPHESVGQLHNLSTQVGDDRVGWLSIRDFVAEVTRGAETWLAKYGDTERVKRNMQKFARLRPEGLPPHTSGPVIA